MDLKVIRKKALAWTWLLYLQSHLLAGSAFVATIYVNGWRPQIHGWQVHNFVLENVSARHATVGIVTVVFNGPDLISLIIYICLQLKLRRLSISEQELERQRQLAAQALEWQRQRQEWQKEKVSELQESGEFIKYTQGQGKTSKVDSNVKCDVIEENVDDPTRTSSQPNQPKINDQSRAIIMRTLNVHAILCLADMFLVFIVTDFGSASFTIARYLGMMVVFWANGCIFPLIVIVNSLTKVNQTLANWLCK